MAKNSRKHIGGAGAALALTLVLSGAISGAAAAAGLPLRTAGPTPDRALAGLAEGLEFKLSRLGLTPSQGSQIELQRTWSAMVDETLLVARRLGCPSETTVSAHYVGSAYSVILNGDDIISGADPDKVLGRLLYMVAHVAGVSMQEIAPTSSSLGVLDQPLSATLATLPFLSTP